MMTHLEADIVLFNPVHHFAHVRDIMFKMHELKRYQALNTDVYL